MGVPAVISLQCFDDVDVCLQGGGKGAGLVPWAEVPWMNLLQCFSYLREELQSQTNVERCYTSGVVGH